MLTVLQEKLAEAHALALAATVVAQKVEAIVDDDVLCDELAGMRRDAEETRARCLVVERLFGEEAADEILAHVNTTREKAADLAGAWFKAGTGPLAAWSFLAMGEAAEVAAWNAVSVLAGAHPEIADLAAWAVDVQFRHLEVALAGSIRLAELADGDAPRIG